MNTETVEKMKQMRLYGMQTAFKTFIEQPSLQAITNDEMAQCLVQSEWDDRKHRAVQRSIQGARFRYVANREGLWILVPAEGWTKIRLTDYLAGIL